MKYLFLQRETYNIFKLFTPKMTMKKLFTILIFPLIFLFGGTYVSAQLIEDNKGTLKKFEEAANAEERFAFFYKTPNRYKENSKYDWLDHVNVFLHNSSKIDDSTSIRYYMVLQSQLQYDIGDYDKSVAIATELHKTKEKLDQGQLKVLLDLLDSNYGKLELFSNQIEIRKEKKESKLEEKIYFYDIYSNVGMHRQAMEDYIREISSTIEGNDHYKLAEYNNNVGNYLRLDKSLPTAISHLEKAFGYIKVYINDGNEDKSEYERTRGELLKGVILGNIGKCQVLQSAIWHKERLKRRKNSFK